MSQPTRQQMFSLKLLAFAKLAKFTGVPYLQMDYLERKKIHVSSRLSLYQTTDLIQCLQSKAVTTNVNKFHLSNYYFFRI